MRRRCASGGGYGAGIIEMDTLEDVGENLQFDTEGRVWFSLSHANTDSRMMVLFLHSLSEALDAETPGW